MRVINLAAGDRHFDGVEGSDLAPEHPDLAVIDLRQPLPYADGSVDVAMMSHALTNLARQSDGSVSTALWLFFFTEVHRVLKTGGWFRLDDAPFRFFVLEDLADVDLECDIRMERHHLVHALSQAGFGWILAVHPSQTNIECPSGIKAAILGNKTWHLSFTLECRKVEPTKYADPGRGNK